MISCFFVGLAGALYALLNNFADPRALHCDLSGNFVIMAVMGGMRSFWGPLVGAAIFVVLQDYLSSQTENWMSFIGLFFVLVVLFFPRGVLGMHPAEGRGMSLLQRRQRLASISAAWSPCDDVSMTVEPGELRAMIGPNGAGKTTFFNLISGFFPPTSGTHPVRRPATSPALPPHERVGMGMARTFQITEIFPELTVRENLRIAVEVAAGYRPAPLAQSRGRRRRDRARASTSCWRWAA